ncbi:DUF58 domain-containing protein [Aliiglaciecola sp. LCG003]|uniref:DUF58 domain-containing protein n=1 Tax=Aliiglaciecola sp. LCG003 TaxID=3053655 RepID=UPI0025723D5E|nr:DUF58 domain-containing protein [Aliiglaciecola sp. LCG003]WJG08238.1 DUF58 domain-containing protein [Aliiglaciecola sp. LCG003]
MIILCYFLLSLFLLSLFAGYFNFAKLDVQLGKVQNGFVDDNIQLPIWFNHGEQSSHGKLQLSFLRQPAQVNMDLDDFSNPIYQALHCEQRGKITLPRITINSFYPLGLFRCWTHLAFESDLIVYPKPKVCRVSTVNQMSEQQFSDEQLSARGHDDFDCLAVYKLGEPLHHVAWKQVAKGRGMISKKFSQQNGSISWLTLPALPSDELENALSQLCFQVLELTRQNQPFGLKLESQIIAPDSGLAHQHLCLAALAMFKPRLAELK